MLDDNIAKNAIETVLTQLSPSAAIGDYVDHTRTDDGDYIVSLTNGKIRLYHAELRSADNLPPQRMPDILARFRPHK